MCYSKFRIVSDLSSLFNVGCRHSIRVCSLFNIIEDSYSICTCNLTSWWTQSRVISLVKSRPPLEQASFVYFMFVLHSSSHYMSRLTLSWYSMQACRDSFISIQTRPVFVQFFFVVDDVTCGCHVVLSVISDTLTFTAGKIAVQVNFFSPIRFLVKAFCAGAPHSWRCK